MARRAARGFLVLAACMALGACALPPPRADPPPLPEPADDAVRMIAVGDSITDADSKDLAHGVPGPRSWVSYAVGRQVEFVGGWAEWGASVERMAEAVDEPFDADVLVILAGTNDAGWTPHDQIGTHLTTIADNAGIANVVLSSVPPNDFSLSGTAELNAFLEELAHHRGWTWVDSAAGVRDGDSYADGMSDDGLHPSEEGARVIGEAIGQAVIEASERGARRSHGEADPSLSVLGRQDLGGPHGSRYASAAPASRAPVSSS